MQLTCRILCSWLQNPVSIDLHKIWEALIDHQQQEKKVYYNGKKGKALSDLLVGQKFLYIMIKGDWLPWTVTQTKSPEIT